ncbi:DNA methyltransferase [Moraxella osloensis]|nr:DNA methyltransferase [Moraxella osloensis]MDK1670711.1 DNA methyltransferase [Moraxella osloensis]
MSYYATLNQKLKQMFQIDRPDLDFGVYRILNARRHEIGEYLDTRLKQKVEELLNTTKQGMASTQQETLIARIKDEFGKRAFDEVGNLIDADALASPDGQAYMALRQQADSSFDEGQVYNHLATFFSRYYDEGDFISQRRYKGDTYAIPYAGEEVMLHWANKDQYYTKSSEIFSNYRIKFDELGFSDKVLNFRLLSADTAKDNQKDNDKKRVFVMLGKKRDITRTDENGEEYTKTVYPVEMSEEGNEMTVWFEYVALDTKSSQDKINEVTHDGVLADSQVTSDWQAILTSPAPTEKNNKRDLFTKHLTNYTTKNTADYFIHKDLGKFLNNELDFYIKNEVMHLDNVVNSESFAEIERSLAIVKCLRLIGRELIGFLASLEDFQKRLWMKKKFVVDSHYCVTLDRVDAELYAEIADNPLQWEQWESLGFRDTIVQKDGQACGDVSVLSNFPFLMVDTSLYSGEFKAKLLRGMDDVDGQTDGVIIHSDNFQGLNLLQEKYRSKIDCIYIDPPYNVKSSEIIYKNGFKQSSWLSLIHNRIEMGSSLLPENGINAVAIDDFELSKLIECMSLIFGEENQLGIIAARINPKGRMTTRKFSLVHEYALFYGKSQNSYIKKLPENPEDKTHNYKKDVDGSWYLPVNLRKQGVDSEAEKGDGTFQERYYPIYFCPETKEVSVTKSLPIEILPIDGSGQKRIWRRGKDVIEEMFEKGDLWVNETANGYQVYFKFRGGLDGKLMQSLWVDSKYSASDYGTKILDNTLGKRELFSYPKSPFTVMDSIKAMSNSNESTILDYFAGSGTTAHATIALNREDNGNRKYILIEQGEYFNTVIKPRIQKATYSENWKDGKPALPRDNKTANETNPYNGISHCLKVIKLESYEDTLNNLELTRTGEQTDLFNSLDASGKDDYLMHYMLQLESKDSILSVADFANPFDYQLKITTDSAGAYTRQAIDLVDTFNYLIGLTVHTIDYQNDRGYVFIEGTLRTGEKTLVFWRNTDIIGYDKLEKTLIDRLNVNPRDKEYDLIYINGDHNIPSPFINTDNGEKKLKVRSIEQAFFDKMFEE